DHAGNILTDISSGDSNFDPQNPEFGNSGSVYNPGLSGDGRFVAFWSTSSSITVNGVEVTADNVTDDPGGFAQVYVYDRVLNKLTMASAADDGTPGDGNSAALGLNGGNGNNGDSWAPAFSADGRFVVFES